MENFQSIFDYFVQQIMHVLPTSPFLPFIKTISNIPYLDVLNWFIPVNSILTITGAWLGSVSLFYIYSIIMRWVKIIGD